MPKLNLIFLATTAAGSPASVNVLETLKEYNAKLLK